MKHLYLIAILAALVSCDVEPAAWLEERLRTDETRRAHAATYIGLGVTRVAHEVAENMAAVPNDACERKTPTKNRFELTLERKRGETIDVSYSEIREAHRDEDGSIRVLQEANYKTAHGIDGAFENGLLLDGEKVWVKDDRSPHWYEGDPDQIAGLRARAYSQMQVLLDSLPGWQAQDGGWVPGEKSLRCESQKERRTSAWLARLEGRGEVLDASFEHGPSKRTFSATWSLEKGYELEVRAVENWSYESVPDMVSPAAEDVVDVERDRRLLQARKLVEEMIQDGIVEPAEESGEK